MYACSLLEKLWFPQPDPTCIYEDNQTCISWSKCSVGGTDWAAHIDLRLGEHFVHDAVEAKSPPKTLKLMPIDTMDNVADLLTKQGKPLPKAAFLTLRKRLMGL